MYADLLHAPARRWPISRQRVIDARMVGEVSRGNTTPGGRKHHPGGIACAHASSSRPSDSDPAVVGRPPRRRPHAAEDPAPIAGTSAAGRAGSAKLACAQSCYSNQISTDGFAAAGGWGQRRVVCRTTRLPRPDTILLRSVRQFRAQLSNWSPGRIRAPTRSCFDAFARSGAERSIRPPGVSRRPDTCASLAQNDPTGPLRDTRSPQHDLASKGAPVAARNRLRSPLGRTCAPQKHHALGFGGHAASRSRRYS